MKRYFPPAVDCVRETWSAGKLHATCVASRSCPDSRSITSGVSPTHQLGGSTFVTAGPASLSVCRGLASEAALLQASTAKHKSKYLVRENRAGVIYRTRRSSLFTGESIREKKKGC